MHALRCFHNAPATSARPPPTPFPICLQLLPYQFLKRLSLNKCGLPETAGLELIASLAEGNRRLNFLGLANNSLGSKTAAALGELLMVNRSLREVDLAWNQIKVGALGSEVGGGGRGMRGDVEAWCRRDALLVLPLDALEHCQWSMVVASRMAHDVSHCSSDFMPAAAAP